MVYGYRIFVRRLCRKDGGWPSYGKWRKFDEEDKKKRKKRGGTKTEDFLGSEEDYHH